MSLVAGIMRVGAPHDALQRGRVLLLAGLGLALGTVALLYAPTFARMAGIWLSTDTYVHGFVILPISAFLIWRARAELVALAWQPAAAGVVVLLALGALWYAAARTEVRVVEQLAAVATVPALVYTFLGGSVVRRIAFPLSYLVFAVPMGDELVPWLMEFTADFTVAALKLSGIAVYRDGLMFSTSSGDFAVEKACSGVRYLIASVAVGSLYAYLTYRSPRRRALFIAVSALVPILANGVRAYLIVVLAHASDMRFAAGADHIIYGWAFFGIVMFGLFIAGLWFREPADAARAQPREPGAPPTQEPLPPRRIAVFTAVVLAVLAAAPILESQATQASSAPHAPPLLAKAAGDWSGPHAPSNDWQPAYTGADLQLFGRYRRAGHADIDVAALYYRGNAGGGELATVSNRIANPVTWREFDTTRRIVRLVGGGEAALQTSWLLSDQGRRVAAWTYVVDGRLASSPVMLKWHELRAKLWGHDGGAAMLAASVSYADDSAAALAALDDFLGAHLAALTACLATAESVPTSCNHGGAE